MTIQRIRSRLRLPGAGTVLLVSLQFACSPRPATDVIQPFHRLPTPTGLSAESCNPCHSEKYETYTQTAHFRTSMLPSDENILGSVDPSRNILRTRNPYTYFTVTKRGKSFYQTAYWAVNDEHSSPRSRRERIAVVVGAGVEGQSYLYWKDDFLYQLPVSYYSRLDEWVNSPGFPDGKVFFARPITPRCLECHGTFFEIEGTLQNPRYRDSYQLGITCWKCHGDGGAHIVKHTDDVPIEPEQDIVNPSKLPRPRQLDICALCHSGVGRDLRASFTFRPGAELSDFLQVQSDSSAAPIEEPGGWLANKLFRQSKCFIHSQEATCSTCHNVHRVEDNLATMSRKCQQCHQPEDCALSEKVGLRIEDLCIECHMPDQESRLRVHQADGTLSPAYRNHRIAIYPDATEKVLQSLSP